MINAFEYSDPSARSPLRQLVDRECHQASKRDKPTLTSSGQGGRQVVPNPAIRPRQRNFTPACVSVDSLPTPLCAARKSAVVIEGPRIRETEHDKHSESTIYDTSVRGKRTACHLSCVFACTQSDVLVLVLKEEGRDNGLCACPRHLVPKSSYTHTKNAVLVKQI